MAIRRLLPPQADRLRPDTSLFIINIVLLMILFFLATGQIMNSSPVKTRLAVTEDLPTDTLPTPLLEVTEGGALNIDGEPVEGEQIAAALSGETAVHVLIAGETPAQELVALLARPELAAFEIRLVTIADRSDQ